MIQARSFHGISLRSRFALGAAWRVGQSPILAIMLLGTIIVASAKGNDASTSFASGTTEDVQDILYLAPARPYLIRLHLLVNGKGFRAMRQNWAEAQFASLDLDHNGVLEGNEIDGLPSPETLRPGLTLDMASHLKVDSHPADGKVTLEECRDYLLNGSATPFTISTQVNDVQINLFPKLDANQDGRLSSDEITGASAKLRRYDQNEDDVISANELQRGIAQERAMAQQELSGALRLLVIMDISDRGVATSRRLLESYDKSSRDPVAKTFRKDEKLSKTELLIESEAFDAADNNHDGKLDRSELGTLSSVMTPSIELTIEVPSATGEFTVNVLRRNIPATSSVIDVRQEESGRWLLVLNETAFSLMAAGSPQNIEQELRSLYVSQFKNLDQDKNEYLEPPELSRFGFPAAFFTQADIDRDGKLFEKEYNAQIEREIEFSKSSISLEVAGDGRSLFRLLDDNPADGRLSLRELADASDKLKKWDANGDGVITLTELSISLGAVFRSGTPRINGPFALGQQRFPGGNSNPQTNPTGTPLSWFVKMDRNGDGDLSPKEFLGRRKLFDSIDTNHDGLISMEEARVMEAKSKAESSAK